MGLLMDGLLMAASVFAGGYCWVLARRVSDLKDLDKGLGGAIVSLTRQIELARATLEEARAASKNTRAELSQLSTRAETAAGQLRLLLASMDESDYRRPAPKTKAQSMAASREPSPAAAKPELPETPFVAERADRANRQEPLSKSLQRQKPMPPITEIPKPRAVRPLSALLRRPKAETVVTNEEDIMKALHAIANGEK